MTNPIKMNLSPEILANIEREVSQMPGCQATGFNKEVVICKIQMDLSPEILANIEREVSQMPGYRATDAQKPMALSFFSREAIASISGFQDKLSEAHSLFVRSRFDGKQSIKSRL